MTPQEMSAALAVYNAQAEPIVPEGWHGPVGYTLRGPRGNKCVVPVDASGNVDGFIVQLWLDGVAYGDTKGRQATARLMPGQDQIIDAVMAQSIQTDAARTHPLLAWVVTRNEEAYPGQFVARLVTDAITPYVLLADTLGGLHAQLPPGLDRSDRQPADPPEVGEVWFLPSG
jgi:hypothetical protein